MEKRGALELSVNTIVIVVLGVTILIIGLAFLDTIREKLGSISEESFEKIEGKFDDLNAQQLITLTPSKFTLEVGKSKVVTLVIANLDPDEYGGVFATIQNLDKDITCNFAATKSAKSMGYDIPSGQQVSLAVLVETTKSTGLGSKVCNVQVAGSGIAQADTEDSLVVTVVK